MLQMIIIDYDNIHQNLNFGEIISNSHLNVSNYVYIVYIIMYHTHSCHSFLQSFFGRLFFSSVLIMLYKYIFILVSKT